MSPEQIIIGSGAEYLYGLIIAMLGRQRVYGIESPSYQKIEQVYKATDVKYELLALSHDGIDSLICADIRLDREDDAQEIFERINSTGIKLSLADLIRNYVLMTDDDQERLYEEYWLVTQELLSKDRLESFFYDYLNMKLDGFTKESEAYRDFKQVYTQGQYTNESMLQEILHYAKQYHIFWNGDDTLGDEINNALAGLRKLNQTTVYLFLFSVFDDYEAGVVSKEELGKILNRVRMPITANKHNSVFLIESFEKLINDSCGFNRIELIFHRHRGRETVFKFI